MLIKDLSELSQREVEDLMKRGDLGDLKDAVLPIIEEVRERGDDAVREYTRRFDNAEVIEIAVTREEMRDSLRAIDQRLLEHLQKAASKIREFHEEEKASEWYREISEGITLGQKITPLKRVGAYVPGGRAAYPSTALMTIIPAKVAGVSEVVVCTPPRPDAKIHPATLAACQIAGADQVFKVGGVQAIAAMAYGTDTIPRVDKIVGPGNAYVTTAKRMVREECEIDFPAGPSEVLIIADERAKPGNVAWDMLAQCEHDPRAIAVLTTTSPRLAAEVEEVINSEIKNCERREIITESLKHSAILKAKTLDECIRFSNNFAPEHLQIITKDPEEVLERIEHAGSIFIGNNTPAAAGDYASGTNHVLPTAGHAMRHSGLNTDHFTKKTTIQIINKKGLRALKETITTLAEAEGLFAHAKAIQARFKEE
ncbi:MAG: histidinol dehydrogenase [Methanosarcinales archaeon]